MDLNLYALEVAARDKLARLRAEAALHALVSRRQAPSPRVRVGLALIHLGRWLRGVRRREAAGVRLGTRVA
jgi:hypothetical protein